jgi:hypothetical protein
MLRFFKFEVLLQFRFPPASPTPQAHRLRHCSPGRDGIRRPRVQCSLDHLPEWLLLASSPRKSITGGRPLSAGAHCRASPPRSTCGRLRSAGAKKTPAGSFSPQITLLLGGGKRKSDAEAYIHTKATSKLKINMMRGYLELQYITSYWNYLQASLI